jgi:hypothetical protein
MKCVSSDLAVEPALTGYGGRREQAESKLLEAECYLAFHKSCGFAAVVRNGSATLRPVRADS